MLCSVFTLSLYYYYYYYYYFILAMPVCISNTEIHQMHYRIIFFHNKYTSTWLVSFNSLFKPVMCNFSVLNIKLTG